jgi:hypothetical protein
MGTVIRIGLFIICLLNLAGLITAQASKTPNSQESFSQQELKEYYKVYSDPDVKHIRAVFNAFLSGKKLNSIEADALKNADKSYLKSKFVVLSHDPHLMGGSNITIMFQEKPDKIFKVWIYLGKGSRWQLRDFSESTSFSKEDIERIRERYRKFLEDKAHAL